MWVPIGLTADLSEGKVVKTLIVKSSITKILPSLQLVARITEKVQFSFGSFGDNLGWKSLSAALWWALKSHYPKLSAAVK